VLSNLLVRDVTILRPGTITDRTDTVADWSTATSTHTNGWLAQRSAAEVLDNRTAGVTGWTLVLPGGTDVRRTDRVTIDAVTYEVDGDPNPAWTPRGEHHVEVSLRRVDG